MGCYLFTIAFRDAPALDRLATLPGLTAYRLFKHRDLPEWYLEGHSAEGDAITFYQSLSYTPAGDAVAPARAVLDALRAELESRKIKGHPLRDPLILQAATLHAALGQPVLAIVSDDDGVDGGFVFEGGLIVDAEFEARDDKIVVAGGRVSAVEPIDWDAPKMLNGVANDVAGRFFGRPMRLTSDPFDVDAGAYVLIAAKG